MQELFCVTKDDAVNLLAAYDWNKSTLEERWFEDDRRVRDSACVHGPALAPSAREQGEVFSCLTCMDDVAKRDSAALACGHWFCRQCWAANMKTHVKVSACGPSACLCCATGSLRSPCTALWGRGRADVGLPRFRAFPRRPARRTAPALCPCAA